MANLDVTGTRKGLPGDQGGFIEGMLLEAKQRDEEREEGSCDCCCCCPECCGQ